MNFNISTAIIFCGGRGRRLYPITKKIPKPLAIVSNKPFIYFLIEQLIDFKISKIVFLSGYKGNILKKEINTYKELKKKTKFIFKKTPVNWETGKRLTILKNIKDENFLLLYSDNLVYFNYDKYLNYANKKKIVNLIIQKKTLANEVGNIQLDKKKINYFERRKKKCQFVELGYGIISKKIFKYLDNKNKSFSSVLQKLSNENKIGCYKVTNKYHSITNVSAIQKSNKTLLNLRKKNFKVN